MRAWLGVLAVLVGCQEAPALLLDPGSCAGCHAEEARTWAESRHARAFVDPVFQFEFNPSRRAWCAGCHAPLAPDSFAVHDQDPRALQGVGCAACHLRDGVLVSRELRPGSPHQTRVEAAFGGPDFCGSCHQFQFPKLGKRGEFLSDTREPMQNTLAQYLDTELPGVMDCLDCHARPAQGHRFPGAHVPEMLREALTLSLCRDGARAVVQVANLGAGHHVPSGGIDRHMTLRVWRSNAPEAMVEGFIGRRFGRSDAGEKITSFDNTIPRGETRRFQIEDAALKGSPGEAINAALWYSYAPIKHAHQFGPEVRWEVLSLRAALDEGPPCSAPDAELLRAPLAPEQRR